jgi:hypothetical protein
MKQLNGAARLAAQLQALPPSHRRRLAGAASAFAAEEATGSQAGPLRMLIGAALREVADLKQCGVVNRGDWSAAEPGGN